MTENIPPSTTAAGANGVVSSANNDRGVPYYERLRRNLRDTLQRKRILDKNMQTLEDSIYTFEQSYLEETGAGNIIKGFDSYIKGSASVSAACGTISGSAAGGSRRKGTVMEQDRVFSRSSASFMRDSPTPSSANTTPSHAPTPPPGFAPASGNNSSAPASVKGVLPKKNKKPPVDKDEDEGEGKPVKRQKVGFVKGE